MKQYKKGLLCIMVLSAMSLMAANDNTIYVNTFDDENGENLSNCSLREAIITAKKNASFGGCSAGNTYASQTDAIQLKEGTYELTKGELKPESSIIIWGKSRSNFNLKSSLNNQFPELEDIKTVIAAKDAKSRLFNTSETRADVRLDGVALKNGYAKDYGGAVYAGGNFTISNGAILNAKADKAGGAIYMLALDAEKEVNLNSMRIENNNAPKGSVLAMSCLGNLKDNKPVVSISQSSIVNNGNASSLSAIDLCGSNTVTFEANTIAKNTANASDGSIIRAISDGLDRLSPYSVISFSSNTIIENNAFSTLYYDDNASKYFSYNILAFNGNGKSCRYLNSQTPDEALQFGFRNNAAELSNANCVIPAKALIADSDTAKNIDVSGTARSELLTDYQQASVYNRFLPLYYPLKSTAAVSLLDSGFIGCSKYDQRGIARDADTSLMLNPSIVNTCDIGSVEKLNFAAADIDEIVNVSQKAMLAHLQADIDDLKAAIANPALAEYKYANEYDLKEAEAYLPQLKNNLIYRAIYQDPFALALPQEVDVGNTQERKLLPLDADHYDVIATRIGIGTDLSVDSTGKPVIKGDPSDLVCRWDASLKKIMIYRTGGSTTSGQFAYCQYTLKEKTGSKLESSGMLTASFVNIAPIAVNDEYLMSTDNNLTVRVNPLENDSDEGDGPLSTLPAGKTVWHKNAAGHDAPIYFESIPAGLKFNAEYEGPCPDQQKNTCYGGTIEFSSKNAFNQFSFSVPYHIYDSEGAQSATAFINLKNPAKNTNESASGGGGSSSIFGFMVLAGLALFRMRKLKA
ncbi:CSLREA domain-containing protein [Acinetobacter sp.]|jgi:CSLREA domain-containing protein|uniref:CSLREA domain-containing protein n=1 Tax=Acinetobacter sp. TaxID=472 RepID=UPI0035B292DF